MSAARNPASPGTLKERIVTLLARVDAPPDDAAFGPLALQAFAWQFDNNALYAAYCARRGRTPETVTDWTGIPAVPTAAFKEVDLVAGERTTHSATFRTSGTTQGTGRRGVHHVPDLSLYHASLLPNFAALVLPDDARLPMLSLVPPPEGMPDSSLAHMIGVIVRTLGAPGSGFFASVEHGLDTTALDDAIATCVGARQPVCLLGTSLSFVHWLDSGIRTRLPAGSRLMDTGGFKGAARVVDETELRAWYTARLGVPATHIVNEYGMTEMCSQFYDTGLRSHVRGEPAGPTHKHVPPGVRTRVVDPETLQPLERGRVGILQHLDLANLGSVLAVQTEDLGVHVGHGFRLQGRLPGATPRGCSIAMDDLLRSAGRRP